MTNLNSSTNPFKILVSGLSAETYQQVTLEYLDFVADVVNESEVLVTTYQETFKVLEYLAKAGAVELIEDPEEQTFKIRKAM